MQLALTVSREFSFRDGVTTSIDLDKIRDAGLDGFASFSETPENCEIIIASGMENCLQVRKKYPWQKHTFTANVPVYTYCEHGWIKSALHFMKRKFTGE